METNDCFCLFGKFIVFFQRLEYVVDSLLLDLSEGDCADSILERDEFSFKVSQFHKLAKRRVLGLISNGLELDLEFVVNRLHYVRNLRNKIIHSIPFLHFDGDGVKGMAFTSALKSRAMDECTDFEISNRDLERHVAELIDLINFIDNFRLRLLDCGNGE